MHSHQRFVRLCPGLSVVLESKFDKAQPVEKFLKPGVDKKNVFYSVNPEPELKDKHGQIWHPGRLENQNGRELTVFKIITNGTELYRRLVFKASKCLARASRASESWSFGFEKGKQFISLAFPRLSDKFEPVFFKIRPWNKAESDEFFIKISALEYTGLALVLAEQVGESDIPAALAGHRFD